MSQTGAQAERGGEAGERNRYRATLNLPQTAFPMKANLVQSEPASMKRWAAMGLYAKIRERSAGRPPFLLHDGPPYANGSLHLGHLLNKTLKDIVVRSRTALGFDCPFVPGWDCHGLPIEQRVVTDLVEAGKYDKIRALPEDQRRIAIRRECRRYAEKSLKVQAAQLHRMLTLGDYEHPYLTMDPAFEGATLDVLASLAERGLVYRALKPVHWSITNETALAEAELEYFDREDISVYVDFEAADPEKVYDAFGLPPDPADDDEAEDEPARPRQRPCFMIWTTTPWTLPANLAVAVHRRSQYALVRIDGNVTVVASDLVEKVARSARAENVKVLGTAPGERLLGLRYRHPFVDAPSGTEGGAGASRVFTIVHAEYVTLEDGTGLVHTAPGHGTDDYITGRAEGLPIYCPVRADGTYDQSVPAWIRGVSIWDANPLIVGRLRESGHLFHDHAFTHSYPHDWRSKTPVIFRCTEQWFVAVDSSAPGANDSLRSRSIGAIAGGVGFIPEWGRNRLRGMLESRPDWCISRQRAWGLPIPAFVRADGSTFMTAASIRAVSKVVREKGSDAWFTGTPESLLAAYDPGADPQAPKGLTRAEFASLTRGPDIIDVWFESGSTWNAVLRERGMRYPADLYLEGSDQHRGWFQSSLLASVGATGQAPYRTLLTHGFMVEKDGRKLSKSRPDQHRYEVDSVASEFGMDVMRWWVASQPYENDIKVDLTFFEGAGEAYRKIRNTLRFMLGNLAGFQCGPGGCCVDLSVFAPTSLEAWALAQYNTLAADVVREYESCDFRTASTRLYDFCNDTLSAVYFAAIKDRLYCDGAHAPRRQRTQTVICKLCDALCRLLSPILVHTADEAFRAHHGAAPADTTVSVHLETFVREFAIACDPGWEKVLGARREAMLALERSRRPVEEGGMGLDNPLDAGLVLPDPEGVLSRFDRVDLADLCGVSRVDLDPRPTAVSVIVRDLRGEPRCDRSWKRDGTVRVRSDGGMLSDRDAAAVGVA